MPNSRFSRYILFIAGLLSVSVVEAHTAALHESGLLSGLLHPLLGWDHLLSILLIGIWTVQQRNDPKLPLLIVFMASLAAGVFTVQRLELLALSEFFVSGALVVLGLLLAFAVKTPAYLNLLIAGAVGLSQGYAHVSMITSSAEFGVGVLVGTLAMFAVGAALSRNLWTASSAPLFRFGAGSVAMTGLLMWV